MKGNVFIKRPVLAMSISILIVIVGLISLFTLPVEQYPNIAPPTVMVSTAYTGADAEAVVRVADLLAAVLEYPVVRMERTEVSTLEKQ